MPEIGLKEWLAVGRVIAKKDLLRHGKNLQETCRFERRFAEFLGVNHALAVTSGTGALVAALTAAGIGPGDEVLVPAYTWMASAAAPVAVGAVPVLVDINESLTIDPADLERRITPYSKAIIPVHMVNAPCDMDAVMAIAKKHNLIVIEDACQAVGVEYKGRRCGAIGHMGAFSFNRYKNLNIGEGGAVVTNDPTLFARAINYHDLGSGIRDYGLVSPPPPFIGVNLRVNEIQGAMLNVQLSRLVPSLARLKVSRATIAEVFQAPGYPRLSPHNDAASAVGATVLFETEAEAASFATRPGVVRVFDNSKHVYTEWEPILKKRTAHPKLDPWAWAARQDHCYDERVCARSLDIMRRTCRIWVTDRRPAWWVRRAAATRYKLA